MALETALQLTAHGRPPVLLAVMNPPPLTGPPLPRLSLWGTFLAERMAFHWHDLCRADSPRAVVRHLAALLRRLANLTGSTPASSSGTRTSARVRVQLANRQAALCYRPRLYRGPVSVLVTSAPRLTNAQHSRGAWRHTVTPAPRVRLVRDIEHFAHTTMEVGAAQLTPQNLARFADALGSDLERLQRKRHHGPLGSGRRLPRTAPPSRRGTTSPR